MSFSIIAAIGKNREIGRNGQLIFHLPADLKYFKDVTKDHTVLMGRTTFFSLPKMLPHRTHIVLTHLDEKYPDGVISYTSLKQLIKDYKDKKEEIFVIGGGYVYSEMLKYADKLYLTEVDAKDSSADTYFPEFDKKKYHKNLIKTVKTNDMNCDFVVYSLKEEL
jgi:dihydrofolate reductase